MDANTDPILRLDAGISEAFLHGRPLALTQREFQLLSVLVAHPNQVVSSERLLEAMWGTATVGDDHPVHVNISRLRGKIERGGGAATMISTVRGRGYVFCPPIPEAAEVRLIYDRHLTLQVVEPNDQPFLGWYPQHVTGTFFMLTSVSTINSSRRVALAIARLWAAVGIHEWNGPMSVRAADGSARLVNAHLYVLSSNRRFRGMRATITL